MSDVISVVDQSSFFHRALKSYRDAFLVLRKELLHLIRVDIPSGLIVAAMLLMFLPTVSRHADNAALLQAFVEDEPLITMQLDGMTAWPWGDPANYLDPAKTAHQSIPSHWLNLRYDGIVYYGGLYLDLALLFWLPLKLIG